MAGGCGGRRRISVGRQRSWPANCRRSAAVRMRSAPAHVGDGSSPAAGRMVAKGGRRRGMRRRGLVMAVGNGGDARQHVVHPFAALVCVVHHHYARAHTLSTKDQNQNFWQIIWSQLNLNLANSFTWQFYGKKTRKRKDKKKKTKQI